MTKLPNDINEAIAQAMEATKAALKDGYTRVQIEIVVPDIELQAQSLACLLYTSDAADDP